MPSMRHVLLGLALVATAIASVVDLPGLAPSPDAQAVSAPVSKGPASKPVAVRVQAPALPGPARFGPQVSDLFAGRRAGAPVVVAPVAAVSPPPVPAAPPLPFQYQGKLMEHDAVVAFLNVGSRTHILRKGDVVADYRVVDITAAGMTFVYLPLNEQQRLNFGSAN